MNKNPLVYIDFGGSRISAIAGFVQDDHALKVLGEQGRLSDDVKSGIVEKMTGAAFKVNEITKLLQNSLKLDQISKVSISVNARTMKHYTYTIESQIYNLVTNKLLNDVEKRCKEDIETDKIYVFQCIPLAYYIDGKRVDNPLGLHGSNIRVDFNVIIGNYLVKESIERSIERTGIAVDFIHLGMEALSTAILEDKDRDQGCAIISFGATTTTLGVYCEGKLQELCVIPLGGMNITKDIQELGVSFQNAELLKCKTGFAMEKMVAKPINVQIPNENPQGEPIIISTLFLSTIIEARLEEILEPIFDQIDAIPYPLHSGIVITGGAAKLKYLPEFIQEKTGFAVRMGSHAEWLSEDTDEKFYDPVYSQAIGSLLLSNDLIQHQVEILQAAIKPKLPNNFIKKIQNKFNDGMGSLFKYDELEKEQNEQK
ncbi:MAG: cell division protein FtsA [Paludibacteraceae bacterium]